MKIQSAIDGALLAFLLAIAAGPGQAQSDVGALSRNLRLSHPASASPCGAIVGQWRWFTGGVVTINPDGTMVYAGANDGVWTCTDPSRNAVTLRWRQGGFVNRLVLSADGTRLSSTDTSQSYVSAKRIGAASHNAVAQPQTDVGPQTSTNAGTGPPTTETRGFSTAHAIAFEQRGDWNGLVQYGKAWTQTEPNNPVAWGIIAIGYGKLRRFELALGPARHATELAPGDWHPWTALGMTYFNLHRYDEAGDAFEHAVKINPRNPNLWNNLAITLTYEPESNCQPAAHTTVALCGRPRKLLQLLEDQKREAGPYQDYIAWYNLGNAFKTVGMQFEKNRFLGDTGPAHDLMLLELKAFLNARDAYRKALHLNTNYASAWNNLGVVESKIGHWQTALGYYQRAASLGDSLSRGNYIALKQYIAYEKQIHCLYTRIPLGDGWYRLYPSVCLPESAFNRSGPIPIPE